MSAWTKTIFIMAASLLLCCGEGTVAESSGPLAAKTFTANFSTGTGNWLGVPSQYGTASYDTPEGALKLEGAPGGFMLTSRIMMHQGYPATFSADIKVASTDPSYYSGIVMYPGSGDYASAIACKNWSNYGVSSSPKILLTKNEWPAVVNIGGSITEDTYHNYKLVWNGSGTITIYLDGTQVSSTSETFVGPISLGLITVPYTVGNSTATWFKNVTATGVFVNNIAGQAPVQVGAMVSGGVNGWYGGFSTTGLSLQSSPVFNTNISPYLGGVELADDAHVASDQAVEPDAGFRSDHHVADDRGGGGDEGVLGDDGGDAVQREDGSVWPVRHSAAPAHLRRCANRA